MPKDLGSNPTRGIKCLCYILQQKKSCVKSFNTLRIIIGLKSEGIENLINMSFYLYFVFHKLKMYKAQLLNSSCNWTNTRLKDNRGLKYEINNLIKYNLCLIRSFVMFNSWQGRQVAFDCHSLEHAEYTICYKWSNLQVLFAL